MPLDSDYCTVSNTDLERLRDAILLAFNAPELEELVRFNFSEGLYQVYTSRVLADGVQVFQLLEACERRGTTVVLLRGARRMRPRKRELIELIREICPLAMDEAAAPSEPIKSVVTALQALRDKTTNPDIAGPLQASRGELALLAKDISTLKGYKSLHDNLQHIQLDLLSADLKQAAADPGSLEMLETRLLNCSMASQNLTGGADLLPDDARDSELEWINDLVPAVEKLSNAIGVLDYRAAALALTTIRIVLRREPANVNKSMTRIARALPVEILASTIENIHEKIAAQDPVQPGLKAASVGLQDLLPRLRGQVVQHNLWQDVENYLAAADEFIARGSLEDFELHWSSVTPLVEALWDKEPDAPWVAKSMQRRKEFEDVAGDFETPMTTDMRIKYARFRRSALEQFFVVDGSLKKLCEAVISVGAPLNDLLQRIPNG